MMKKQLALMMLVLMSAAVRADELADGVAAWDRQDYASAFRIFSKLAPAGQPDAQLMLGEMYGFGEGVPENMERAEHWLRQAQARGNADAAASLATMQLRSKRKTEIAYFASTYDGADVKYEKFGCVEPVFPEKSVLQPEIKELAATMKTWRACYDRFVANLDASLPPGKAIPADLAKLMSVTELQQARAGMNKVYETVAADASARARRLIAANDAWVEATRVYTVGMARKTEDDARQRQRELDDTTQRARAALDAMKAGR
jgi:hypothetical protein